MSLLKWTFLLFSSLRAGLWQGIGIHECVVKAVQNHLHVLVVLVEVVATHAQLRLDLNLSLWGLGDIGDVLHRHHVKIVDKAENG